MKLASDPIDPHRYDQPLASETMRQRSALQKFCDKKELIVHPTGRGTWQRLVEPQELFCGCTVIVLGSQVLAFETHVPLQLGCTCMLTFGSTTESMVWSRYERKYKGIRHWKTANSDETLRLACWLHALKVSWFECSCLEAGLLSLMRFEMGCRQCSCARLKIFLG
jgi:hypothetical protein